MDMQLECRSENIEYFRSSNGFDLAYRDIGTGPLVVCLHGFPDTFETWNLVQGRLVSEGFRTIALALRGYVPSGIPDNHDYSLKTLSGDVLTLLDHLGIVETTIIGHDWGASIGYAFAALYPARVNSLVTLAIPPLTVFPSGLRESWARPHNLYLGRGAISNWLLRRSDLAEVERLICKWSPNWASRAKQITRMKRALSDSSFSRAAVDYYAEGLTSVDRKAILRPIQTPTLMIYGGDEPLVRREAYQKALPMVGSGSETICLNGVGHWPHLENSKAFHALLVPFLKRHR